MARYIDADHFDTRVRMAGGMVEYELTEDFKDGVLTTLSHGCHCQSRIRRDNDEL